MKVINKIKITKRQVWIEIENNFKQYFYEDFWMSSDEIDFSLIPKEVLIIPFILNIAPIIWACNLNISTPVLDSNFKKSLNGLKRAFKKQYPELSWNGTIKSRGINVKTDSKFISDEIVMLFSGGIDSLSLSQANLDKKQYLLTILDSGSNLGGVFFNKKGKYIIKDYAKSIGSNSIFIKSNFRNFINYEFLSKNFFSISNWWGEVQHGIGLAGFLIIPGHLHNIKTMLMAADFSGDQMLDMRWGSSKLIMSHLKMPNSNFFHTCYDLTRQDKIKKISEQYRLQKKITRIICCFTAKDEFNCGKCKKCILTMTGFIAAGVDYRNFDFTTTKKDFIKNTKNLFQLNDFLNYFFWSDIQRHILPRQDYVKLKLDHEFIDILMRFAKIDMEKKYRQTQWRFKLLHQIKFFIRKIPLSSIMIKQIKSLI